MTAVETLLNYSAPSADRSKRIVDMRAPTGGGAPPCPVRCTVADARQTPGLGLETSGFELFDRPSTVRNWSDATEVMNTYYSECRALAAELTGASHTFTFDHVLRDNNHQTVAGGIGEQGGETGPEAGGGFIHSVHMDYTTASTWQEYLGLHGIEEPRGARRVVALNFWRPLVDVVEDNALAVCDARTVTHQDVTEVYFYGYGPPSYSWHNIGISTYGVTASPRHRWYYYPHMRRNEVLVIKSYDSAGVIGGTCPHTAFSDPASAPGTARRSVELRVLCFVGA